MWRSMLVLPFTTLLWFAKRKRKREKERERKGRGKKEERRGNEKSILKAFFSFPSFSLFSFLPLPLLFLSFNPFFLLTLSLSFFCLFLSFVSFFLLSLSFLVGVSRIRGAPDKSPLSVLLAFDSTGPLSFFSFFLFFLSST